MGARHLNWYDYDRDQIVECGCGWSGKARDYEEIFREVLDVTCPDCDTMLLVVAYPTHEETRAAAAAGNESAIRTLPQVEAREKFLAEATDSELKEPDELPDIEGDEIFIEWDFEETEDGTKWTVLRHEGEEIFRERAYWEGIYRFEVVLWTVREKYGSRLAELRPAESSWLYLLGDYLWADGKVKSLNAEIRDYRNPVWDPESYIDVEDRLDEPNEGKRNQLEMRSALERIADIECSECHWTGHGPDARVFDRGRYLDVGCGGCRRPLFQISPDPH